MDDIKEKGLSADDVYDLLHGGVCHHTSIPHKHGNKIKEKKKILLKNILMKAFHTLSCAIRRIGYCKITCTRASLITAMFVMGYNPL